MDQGMIAIFVAYFKKTFSQGVRISNSNEGATTLKEFWRSK
jgi:hypothetical protein